MGGLDVRDNGAGAVGGAHAAIETAVRPPAKIDLGFVPDASEGTWDMTWDGKHLWASQRTNENWPDAKIFCLAILDDHDARRVVGR